MTENKTAESIVAEAMVNAGAPLMHSRVEEAVVTALREHGLLVSPPTGDEREELYCAVGEVTSNAANFPERAIPRLLGQDMNPLTNRLVDAVLAAGFRLVNADADQEVDGSTSDGYHTFDELYEYRMLYNAHAAHGWLAAGIPVVKSWKHSDGEPCFGGGWFIVTATLPAGQVSNHYKAEHWGLFKVPEVELPPEYDGHTPQDAARRLRIEAEHARRLWAETRDEREALDNVLIDAREAGEGLSGVSKRILAAGFRLVNADTETTEEQIVAAIEAGLSTVDWAAIRDGAADPEEAAAHAIRAALKAAAVTEVEWEYGWAADEGSQHWYGTREEAEEFTGAPRHFRRRKAGPWEEVRPDGTDDSV